MTDQPSDPAPATPPPAPPANPPGEEGTALSIRRVSEVANLLPPVPRGLESSSWALIQHATMLARIVANTNFVPATFRRKPDSIAAAFLLCHELRIGPMMGLRQLYVTEVKIEDGKEKGGDILIAAQLLRAIVRRGGHRLWVSEYTTTRVTWNGQRSGDEHILSVTWTMDDAKRAKLIRFGSAWEKTPRAMLSARASAELCRVIGEDELGGLYAVEEFQDDPKLIEAINVPVEPHPDEPEGTDTTTTAGQEPRSRSRRLSVPVASEAPTEPVTAPIVTRSEEVMPNADGRVAEATVPQPPPSEATPPAPVEPPQPARATRTRARTVTPSTTEPPIPLPDGAPGEAVGAGPTAEASPGPGLDTGPTASGEAGALEPSAAPPSEPSQLTAAQQVAMLARQARLDRKVLCISVSDRRTDSARELTAVEALEATQHARAVLRGEEKPLLQHDGLTYLFERVTTPALVAELINALRLLFSRSSPSMNELLAEVDPGWRERGNGKVDEFLRTIPERETLAALRYKVGVKLAEIDPGPYDAEEVPYP